MTLDKEAFKRWLAKQPDDREFNYWDCRSCLLLTWAKEEYGAQPDYGEFPGDLRFAAARAGSTKERFTVATFKAELAEQLHKEGV